MINAATATSTSPAASSGTGAANLNPEFRHSRSPTRNYGVDILRVQEIRSYEKPTTTIANDARASKGVVNLRGRHRSHHRPAHQAGRG